MQSESQPRTRGVLRDGADAGEWVEVVGAGDELATARP